MTNVHRLFDCPSPKDGACCCMADVPCLATVWKRAKEQAWDLESAQIWYAVEVARLKGQAR